MKRKEPLGPDALIGNMLYYYSLIYITLKLELQEVRKLVLLFFVFPILSYFLATGICLSTVKDLKLILLNNHLGASFVFVLRDHEANALCNTSL